MQYVEEYAKLIEKANPDYVEIKAYMCVGSSRDRLTLDNMPTFDEVKSFAKKIGDECGKELVNESEISRVVLLEFFFLHSNKFILIRYKAQQLF